MSRIKGTLARLRAVIGWRAAESRMEEEFRFHVDMETARLTAAGVPVAEAERKARMAFGGLDTHREAMRDGRGARLLDDLWADIRYAVRGMRRSPGYALAIALTLGVGIGVNGITFGYVNSLLFRPLPAHNPEQLVGVFTVDSQSGRPDLFAWDDYLDLRDRSGIFSGVAGRTDGPLNLVVPPPAGIAPNGIAPNGIAPNGIAPNGIAPNGTPEVADVVWGEFVTGNYFTVLSMRPVLGRLFTAADSTPETQQQAVLSHDAWRRRFRGDSSIIGRTVRLNGTAFTITGVAPEGFRGIRTFGFWPEFWVPLGMHNILMPGSTHLLEGRDGGWLMLVGRMRDGWSRERTAQAVTRFARGLEQSYPATNRARGMMVIPGTNGFDHPAFVKPRAVQLASAFGIFAAVLTLLVICANLANLQLARSQARAREFAIRLSLGCSRLRLTRQLLVEAMLLAIPGALFAGVTLFASSPLESYLTPRLQFRVGFNPAIDTHVIVYTAATAVLAVLLFGLGPALRASRPDIAPSLSAVVGFRRRRRHGTRASLVISQLALSVMLLVAGMLFTRSLMVARSLDVGFDPRQRVLLSVDLGLQGYDRARGLRFFSDALARVRGIPGVQSATVAFPTPFSTYDRSTSLFVDGIAGSQRDHTTDVPIATADVDFIDALGLRLEAGRAFAHSDSNGTAQVMVVSRQLASRLWKGKNPVGRVARVGGASGPEITVVGIVGDTRFSMIGEENQMRAWIPLRQNYSGWHTLVVHAEPNAERVIPAVRAVIASLDPTLPLFGVTTLEQSVNSGFATNRSAASVGAFFGVLALLIASIGLYAVVAGSVTERTREIGVRMALGASPSGVMRVVMQSGARLGLIGLILGMAGAFLVAQLMQGLLYGLSPIDPLTFALVPLVLLCVVLLATIIPARRAVRLDPVLALRSD